MEFLIQTNKSIWYINKKGIRRVSTWDWSKVRETFDVLFLQQEGVLKKAINSQGPVIQAIERAVEEGSQTARKNESNWLEKGAWRP